MNCCPKKVACIAGLSLILIEFHRFFSLRRPNSFFLAFLLCSGIVVAVAAAAIGILGLSFISSTNMI